METRSYKVNLRNSYYTALSVGLSQYDTGVILDFEVYDGAEAAVFDSGTTAKIQGVRPSGIGFNADCTLSGNIATVTTTTDMTGEYGTFPVELRFYSSGVDVGTINFIFAIEKAAHPDGTIDADITHEQDIVDKINQILIQTTPDTTLTQAGVAADSKTVGDNIRRIDGQIGTLGTRITNVEDDISYQSQRIDRTNKIKAPVIWEEASGYPAVFDDGANMYIKDLTITLTPSQDLNGYDSAWAGGNGKNLLKPRDAGDTQTVSGMTFTSLDDGSLMINGTATGLITFLPTNNTYDGNKLYLPAGTYIVSGAENVPDSGTYVGINVNSTGGAYTATSKGTSTFTVADGDYVFTRLRIPSGIELNNVIVKPMIRRADITDDTWAPYSNICPISGAESVTVKVTGKNIIDNGRAPQTGAGVSFVQNADGSITIDGSPTTTYGYNLFENWNALNLLPNKTYHIRLFGGDGNVQLQIYVDNVYKASTTGNEIVYTVPSDAESSYARLRVTSGQTFNNLTVKPVISYEPITEWIEPATALSYNVDFGQTIYGGTVNPILWDLQGGDIVFDRKVFSVGELTWSKQSGNIFKATPDNVTGSAGYDLSDTFRRNPVADSAMENGDYKLTVAGTLYVKMEGFGTAAGFKAAYADAKFCAKLAHSEIGSMYPDLREITTAYLDNVITAQPDKGNVTNIKVTYPADTKAYIDKAIATISG